MRQERELDSPRPEFAVARKQHYDHCFGEDMRGVHCQVD